MQDRPDLTGSTAADSGCGPPTEVSYRRVLESLEVIANLDDYQLGDGGVPGLLTILRATQRRVQSIFPMDYCGFFIADSDELDFPLACCHPQDAVQVLNQQVDGFVQDGTFAWALDQTRAIVLRGQGDAPTRLLHVLATRHRVVGMFLGVVDGPRLLDELSLRLLSVVLINCAYAVETSQLHLHMRAHTEQLQHDIEERTQELRKAKNMAESSAKMKSEFLSIMSHEIRTPLNGIAGMLSLLQTTSLTRQQIDYLRTATHSCDTLLNLINDILDLSKIEAGRLEMEAIPFDLRTLVEDVTELLAERAQSKGLELACLVSADVPCRLLGDPTRIRQLLLNLVGNAIKFTDDGEVVVRVNVEDVVDGEVMLRFLVRDTGVGIPRDAQERIFDSFSQGDGSTTRKYGGSGLGLTICKRLVAAMHGDIGLHSEPGEGSTFWFTVKLGEAELEGLGFLPMRELAGLRVLVADSNETSRELFRQQLGIWGVQVRCVGSGERVLAALQESVAAGRPYQVAIIDRMLKGRDGIEVARDIRNHSELADIKMILITAFGVRADPRAAQQEGFCAFLTKPVRVAKLHDMLAATAGLKDVAWESLAVAGAPAISGLDGRRVLVVDDNETNQHVAVAMLHAFGIKTEVADTGRKAAALAKRRSFDLILMDCQMPEMDGFEATRLIRGNEPAGQRVPIVAVTSDVLGSVRERCRDAGMDDFLGKPVKLEDLSQILRAWLGDAADDATQQAAEVIDESAVNITMLDTLRRLMGREKFASFVGRYLATSASRIGTMGSALGDEDAEAIRFAAHSLMGSSGNVGATALAEACAELEDTVKREGVQPDTAQRIDRVREALEAVGKALHHFIR